MIDPFGTVIAKAWVVGHEFVGYVVVDAETRWKALGDHPVTGDARKSVEQGYRCLRRPAYDGMTTRQAEQTDLLDWKWDEVWE